MSNKAVVDWFDRLENVLESESKLSGLLEHSSSIGQAREFLVARVLKTILPTSVHIGSGKIINHLGHYSKQIDIIVYDPRFPLMKVDGGGLYFVEGVLAAIEVKSNFNINELQISLDNCKSVLILGFSGLHPEEAEARISLYMKHLNMNRDDAKDVFHYKCMPATYIFSFRSDLSLDTTCKYIANWWKSIGCANSARFPLLPRIINSGNIVSVVNDGRIMLADASGKTAHTMSIFKTDRRFRWFALHLMDAVSQRLGLRNFAENFEYNLMEYYPNQQYLEEIQRSGSAKFITRTLM